LVKQFRAIKGIEKSKLIGLEQILPESFKKFQWRAEGIGCDLQRNGTIDLYLFIY